MLKMSTPTDGKEVVMEKGEASIDEKYDDWIAKADEMVEWLYDYYYMHFRPTLEEKIADMEYQIDMCIHALNSIPQGKFLLWIIQKKNAFNSISQVIMRMSLVRVENRQSEYESAVFELTKGR